MADKKDMKTRPYWDYNWDRQLVEYVDAAGKQGFEYGTNDCAMFACNWVRFITGWDPAEKFRGTYNTEMGCYMSLKKHGTGELPSTFDQYFDRHTAPHLAQRGDICCVQKGDDQYVMGVICAGEAAFLEEEGISTLPLASIKIAWKVG